MGTFLMNTAHVKLTEIELSHNISKQRLAVQNGVSSAIPGLY